uniref:Inositol polyphosphate 5-phosphatase OCRL-1-like n=1 Tax=Dermatophagoides pteronyssinus TaxID=6956 RepID=A0A6P6XQC3_DERPT|nr:inositol polyphosphate 5-phosphatase OCRL-1-like [Dermatophagoides pteronyssinus]
MATKLKTNHKCLAKLNVAIILDGNIQSSRLIGLIQADYGSYGLFIWNTNANINDVNVDDDNKIIETIIPIDLKFHYQLVTIDPILLQVSENGSDLALFITYDKFPTNNNNQSSLLNKNLTEQKSLSIKDSILLEYDPLMINDDNDGDKKFTDQSESIFNDNDNNDSNGKQSSSSYRFILSYNEMTEKFITQLQHIVSVSHRTFTESIDFEWTKQYLQQIPLEQQKKTNEHLSKASTMAMKKSNSSSSSSKTSTLLLFDDYYDNHLQPANSNQFINELIDLDINDNHHNHLKKSSSTSSFDYNNLDNNYNDNDLSLLSDNNHFENDYNRELLIQTETDERRNEYVRYINYTIFIGTWNVNGQILSKPELMRKYFLGCDSIGPDFYAIGFQELDLSKEAFLFNDYKKEEYWLQICEQSLHPDRQYFLLKKIRLIGMMLVIFAAREFRQYIKNVAAETVGTGILGKMGNKGGVAIRFELHDTSICLVNCHLAAHVEQYERRNQDFREINSRLQFMNLKIPKRIYDHDQIYWFGDLNYRIMTSDTDYVKKLLTLKEFDKLLAIDQLRNQMKERNCFQGFQEGKINHMPSYKYNTGTNEWDSSEKRRPPAWCDRILWRGEMIQQTIYRSHPELKDSDHKPVSSLFQSQVLLIDHTLKRKVYEDVMKKLDKVENELLPQVSIDTTEINFGPISFKDNNCRLLTLTNIGQSRIRYRFINKPNDKNFCKQWLRVTPSTGSINIKEDITIVFELNFDDPTMAYRFNYGLETLSDTLVLSLIGGKDIFITISGDYHLSCFGCSLETLVQMEKTISSITLKEFQQKYGDYKLPKQLDYHERLINIYNESMETTTKNLITNRKLSIPKELYILIDHLYRNGYVNVNIFQISGMENEFYIIRDSIDSGEIEKINNVSEHSVAEALLLFLETLPESIIPFKFYDRIQHSNKNHSECKQIYNELPEIHRLVFQYLIMFLQEMCNNSGADKPLNKLYIAKLFGPILIRRPPESFYTFRNNQNQNHQSGIIASSSSSSSLSSQMFINNGGGYNQNKIDTLTPEQFFINYFLNLNTW